MLKRALSLGLLAAQFVSVVGAQAKVPCYSGDKYPSCTPAERLAKAKMLANAKTAVVIIAATQGIACGDGSDGCFRTDGDAISIVQRAVEESELSHNLTKAEPKKADILLNFTTRDRRSLQLCAYDADSNNLLWCEDRSPSISLDNDSSREIDHFLRARRASQK
jgi:hypothetical protein